MHVSYLSTDQAKSCFIVLIWKIAGESFWACMQHACFFLMLPGNTPVPLLQKADEGFIKRELFFPDL